MLVFLQSASTLVGVGGGGEPSLNLYRGQPDHPIRRRGVGTGGAKDADRRRSAVLQIAHVGGVPLLIRFRGPHGDKHAVAVAGVRAAPAVRRGVGFDAPAGRATVAAQHAGGRFPGGGRRAWPETGRRRVGCHFSTSSPPISVRLFLLLNACVLQHEVIRERLPAFLTRTFQRL